jgi:hypothetical protein
MADMTANPPRGVLSAPPRAPREATREAPTWGSLPGAARSWAPGAQTQGRPADRIPPRVTAADPGPEPLDDLADDWGADPVFGPTAASAALAGFNAVEARRFQGARTGLFLGGGVLSLALVGLIGVWGYKVVLREVLGVPVVAAEAGPMRVEPENPGGVITADAGLSVNAVAADGTAAPPSDVLTLAPPTAGLAPEDMEVAQTDAEAGEVQPQAAPVEAARAAIAEAQDLVEATPAVVTQAVATQAVAAAPAPPETTLTATLLPAEGAMTPEEVLAFADSVATGIRPPVAVAAVPVPAAAPATRLAADVPGVAVAVRPPARPAAAVGEVEAVTLTSAEVLAPAPEAEEVALTASIPAGTHLVQLGAFDSAAVAASEWERLQGPFGEFLDGKQRVIQEAESGGRTFFRLRAMGFEDLAAARRLCAALVAEDAGCIPVVVQ